MTQGQDIACARVGSHAVGRDWLLPSDEVVASMENARMNGERGAR